MNRKRAKIALRNTAIATLIVILVELGCAIYLMVKCSMPFADAVIDTWEFSCKGVLGAIGGLMFYFFFVYFAETDKEN